MADREPVTIEQIRSKVQIYVKTIEERSSIDPTSFVPSSYIEDITETLGVARRLAPQIADEIWPSPRILLDSKNRQLRYGDLLIFARLLDGALTPPAPKPTMPGGLVKMGSKNQH